MKKLLLISISSLLFLSFAACETNKNIEPAKELKIVKTIDGFKTPESVAIANGKALVSNIGEKLEPMTLDNDGFISIVNLDGTIEELKAFTGLDAPKGVIVYKNNVYTADINRIIGFNIKTKQKTFEAKLEGQLLFNDLLPDNMGNLIISDTAGSSIYKLNLETKEFTKLASDVLGANGIFLKGEKLTIAGMGADFSGGYMYEMNLQDNSFKKSENCADCFGRYDGIDTYKNNSFIVSDWGSDEAKGANMLLIAKDKTSKLYFNTKLTGPGDFVYNKAKDELWIPSLLQNQVIIAQ